MTRAVHSYMKMTVALCLLLFQANERPPFDQINKTNSEMSLVEISQELLYAARTGEPVDTFTHILKNIHEKALEQLQSDEQKKAFWINIYNAYTQIILRDEPEQYSNRNRFFKSKQIAIAGHMLSLDDVEHGILRRSKIKWSLGYLNKPFPSGFEKKNRVKKLDWRIHFALNCGAKSCPPIAYYKPEGLGRQLDIATTVYLRGECNWRQEDNIVEVPAIMGWFRRDFGGKDSMRTLLKLLEIIPPASKPVIRFKTYDWELFLQNYKSE